MLCYDRYNLIWLHFQTQLKTQYWFLFHLILVLFIILAADSCPMRDGYCVTVNGHDQNSGVSKLNGLDGNTGERQQECLELCKSTSGATACEVIWDQSNRGCYVHTDSDLGFPGIYDGVDNHRCWVFKYCPWEI